MREHCTRLGFCWFLIFVKKQSQELTRVNPDRNIFSLIVELTSTFLLYRGLVHHHHRILKLQDIMNLNFLTPMFAIWSCKPLIFQTQFIWSNIIHILKFLRYTTLGCKDRGIRKSEFWQRLNSFMMDMTTFIEWPIHNFTLWSRMNFFLNWYFLILVSL